MHEGYVVLVFFRLPVSFNRLLFSQCWLPFGHFALPFSSCQSQQQSTALSCCCQCTVTVTYHVRAACARCTSVCFAACECNSPVLFMSHDVHVCVCVGPSLGGALATPCEAYGTGFPLCQPGQLFQTRYRQGHSSMHLKGCFRLLNTAPYSCPHLATADKHTRQSPQSERKTRKRKITLLGVITGASRSRGSLRPTKRLNNASGCSFLCLSAISMQPLQTYH